MYRCIHASYVYHPLLVGLPVLPVRQVRALPSQRKHRIWWAALFDGAGGEAHCRGGEVAKLPVGHSFCFGAVSQTWTFVDFCGLLAFRDHFIRIFPRIYQNWPAKSGNNPSEGYGAGFCKQWQPLNWQQITRPKTQGLIHRMFKNGRYHVYHWYCPRVRGEVQIDHEHYVLV